jgi:hypothetical protein
MRAPLFFLLAFAFGHGLAIAAVDAQDLLAASDAIRNPGRSFSVTVTLTEFQAGKQVDTSTLTTYARAQEQGGQFASLVRFVLPARDAGMLAVRKRLVDVALLVVVGVALWFLSATIPNQPL